ncbi:HD domain-containing protein [Aeoliella sp.]|uniref:HD domain-containing protein n=1 Tax=Aeoliella sp. TaxID=2795800 RepID=UPI003CCBEF3B
MSDLVRRATSFAERAHESIDQRRKYTNEPYIVHPHNVAMLVESVTDCEVTIAAAWLHDVVEDTPIGIGEVQAAFGKEVARLVADLTDIAKPEDGNRKARKAIDRRHTAEADPRAKTVKLADIIDNLSQFQRIKPGFAPVFLEECESLLAVLTEGSPVLYEQAETTIGEARVLLQKGLLGPSKRDQ